MRYACIGGGATATTMLWQHVTALVREIGSGRVDPAETPIRISVFEKAASFGPGVAYDDDNLDCHLVNTEPRTLSIDPGDKEDFLRWLAAREESLRLRYPALTATPFSYPPRAVVGLYLSQRFQEAEALAGRHGIVVERVRREVVDIAPCGGELELRCRDGSAFRVDRALVATGHWPPSYGRHCEPLGAELRRRGTGGYFTPWPAAELRAMVPPGVTAHMLGTSLTAIDAALTLLEDGGGFARDPATGELVFRPKRGCRSVVMYSRRGLLPKVRSTVPAPVYVNPYLARDGAPLSTGSGGPLGYDELMTLFRKRLEYADKDDNELERPNSAAERFDWDAFLDPLAGAVDVTRRSLEVLEEDLRHALCPSARWNRLHYAVRDSWGTIAPLFSTFSMEDKRRFDTGFFRVYSTYAGAMPVDNAEKLVALMKAGRLKIVNGFSGVQPNAGKGLFEIGYVGADGRPRIAEAAYLVNAIGQERAIDAERSPLLENGIKRGVFCRHEAGGIEVDYKGSSVKTRDNAVAGSVFAVGAMTLGERIGSSALSACVKYCQAVVEQLMGELVALDRTADASVTLTTAAT